MNVSFQLYDKVELAGPTAIPEKDSLIYIRVYQPIGRREMSEKRRITVSHMIAILGFQTLDKVRDLINCISDLSLVKEVSENILTKLGPLAKVFFFTMMSHFIDDLMIH